MQYLTARLRNVTKIEWIFRVGVAACFVGHGAFGLITKSAWIPYFALVGIPESVAYRLMPVIGAVDILVGLLALMAPRPVVLMYMVVWSVWTASLRPLTGESVWEFFERAGNFGVPLAFLLIIGVSRPWRTWFRRVRVQLSATRSVVTVARVLQGTTVALLVGHGMLILTGANGIVEQHLAAMGVTPGSAAIIGYLDLLLALAVAIMPVPPVLVAVVVWKLGIEALFPISGAPIWEFVERGGSYAAPVLLLLMRGLPAFRLARSARQVTSSVAQAAASRVPPIRVSTVAIALAAWSSVPADLSAQQRDSRPSWPVNETAPSELLVALRQGGLVLACRHTHTDRSRGDQRQVNFADRTTQRNLSSRGEEEARTLGQVIDRLGVPVGDVYASPYARTWETATLAFGRADTTSALRGNSTQARRDLLSAPVNQGNRVLMTHVGVLSQALRGYRDGGIGEGDCVVLEPRDSAGFVILGHVGLDVWSELPLARR